MVYDEWPGDLNHHSLRFLHDTSIILTNSNPNNKHLHPIPSSSQFTRTGAALTLRQPHQNSILRLPHCDRTQGHATEGICTAPLCMYTSMPRECDPEPPTPGHVMSCHPAELQIMNHRLSFTVCTFMHIILILTTKL